MRMVRRGAFVACICAICLLLFVKPTMAQQNTADVVGTVTDSTGAVIPNATVTITNVGTNISQTVTSAENGDYTFTLLQVGTYSLKVESNGFKTFSVPNIALSSGDRARVDAKMEVGNAYPGFVFSTRLRKNSYRVPWKLFVPAFVITFTTPPPVRPTDASYMLVETFTS